MDIISKEMSIFINKRLFRLLDKYGTKFQFGGIFTLKLLYLYIKRNHNLDLETHVAFVYLVKDYDTAHHKLLIKVLGRFGAPPKLCSVIARLYKDLHTVLKIG